MKTRAVRMYGEAFYQASLGEPMSCIIGGYHANYHTNKQNYDYATASFNGSMVNAKSPFGLIALGTKYGDVINLIAEGDDEEKLFELNL